MRTAITFGKSTMAADYQINIVQPGPRPPYYKVAERLWGEGCDIDSDGNSNTPEDSQWTELTIQLRGPSEKRVDIDPVSSEPLILQVRASTFLLADETARFIVECSGGTAQYGTPMENDDRCGSVLKHGQWLYGDGVKCAVRISRRDFWPGTGDCEDPPEIAGDRAVECYELEFHTPVGEPAWVGGGVYSSIREATECARKLLGESLQWESSDDR